MAVHFGIAGFSYADWKNTVYPASCKDPLAFCARYVEVIEINSTFYSTPAPRTTAAWVERTRARGTLFLAKLGQVFTHEHRLETSEVTAFRDAMRPIALAGRLRALLAQFPFTFTDTPAHRTHLAHLVARFESDAPVAVEVRHGSWQTASALAYLRQLGVSLVHLDHPARAQSFDLGVTDVQAHDLAYFRLHGRNDAAWWRRGAGRDEVYDWTYSADEVDDIAVRLRAIAATAGSTFVVANNHFEGKAMKLALELMARHEGRQVDVPEPLLATYPDLVAVARRSGQGRLFG
ncbi:MAG: DUF72 domain-containing protein [Planctomycetota bacterium]